jgi:hypothetical protein
MVEVAVQEFRRTENDGADIPDLAAKPLDGANVIMDIARHIDGGVLANSRYVEAWTALLIGINIRYRTHSGLRITGV